jgi:hypothetical protein
MHSTGIKIKKKLCNILLHTILQHAPVLFLKKSSHSNTKYLKKYYHKQQNELLLFHTAEISTLQQDFTIFYVLLTVHPNVISLFLPT